MNNVIYVRTEQLNRSTRTEDPKVSRNLVKSALGRLLAHARIEGMENTVMMLELTLTAVDVDYEDRRT